MSMLADDIISVDWFQQMKEQAWKRYQELPAPTRMNENWRFANLRYLSEIDTFQPAPFAAVDAPELVEASARIKKVSGRLIFVDDNLAAARQMDSSLEAKGVIFTTMVDALVRYPEKVREYFMKHSPELGSEKYESLHLAMLRNGVFLFVPEGVEVENPFVVWNWTQQDGGASFPHTLFILGENAKAELIEFQQSATPDTRHLVIANSHLFAADGAKLSHTVVQNWNRNTYSFQLNTNNAGSNTQSKSVVINTGSAKARQEVHGRIFGSGSNVEMYSLNVTTGSQEIDQRTLQTHIAPNSRSDLLFKNALAGQSRTIFSGLIIVEENAQQTDAYQTNNNLMLSEDAEANSLPGLEIKANDVKCSHGATTGRIDESELFYFLARGIPRKMAQQLMIFGYFEEIIAKITSAELAEQVRDLVHTVPLE